MPARASGPATFLLEFNAVAPKPLLIGWLVMFDRRAVLPVVLLLITSAVSARHAMADPGQGVVPTGFTDQLIVQGLRRPVGMTFLPDGRLLFIEQKTKRIRMIVGGNLAATDPIGTIDSVETTGPEQGLLGIAVDPGWPAHPYIYVYYDALGKFIRISRLVAVGDLSSSSSGNLMIDPASRYDLLRDIPDQLINHNAGTLRFGTDGMLYASLGEDQTPCAAQDTTSLRGVILRLDVSRLPSSGPPDKSLLVAPGNPFSAHPNPNARLVWAMGLRNPFRFQVDRADGSLFVADVGYETYEEVDHVTGPGLNLGWPFFEGTQVYLTTQCGVPAPQNVTYPIYEYDGSGRVMTSRAVIGGAVYRNTGCPECDFPPDYEGDYFFSDYYGGFLRRLKFTGGVWGLAPQVPGQGNATDWGTGFNEVSDYGVGPDGALWYCRQSMGFADNTGQIRHIVHDRQVGSASNPVRVVRFAPPFPSPARGSVELDYELPGAALIELGIYDPMGRLIRRLAGPEDQIAGRHRVWWNGAAENGQAAPSAVYVARLTVNRVPYQRRIPLLR